MITLLVLLPLCGALAAWLLQSETLRPRLLALVTTLHLALVFACLSSPPPPSPNGWIHLDPLGQIVLLSVSILFCSSAWYATGYLAYRKERSNRIYCAGILVSLSAATLTTATHHLGLFWVAVEATTLTMAPLIYFNSNSRSIEATWKYLLICSIGVALALLGLFFMAYATMVAGMQPTLLLDDLMASSQRISPTWLHAAFAFLLVGFGTKVGLAPLHTWKPDAYGEAPGMIGALLAGGLVNCAFLGMLRVYQVSLSSSEFHFMQESLIVLGLVSMGTAAVFMARQADLKRCLAYSSVEHVGILTLGLGIGGTALFGCLLHLIGNGISKGILFLTSGNIHRSYNSKSTHQVRGVIRRLPWTGGIFLIGFLAITGTPPFSPFISMFSIVNGAFAGGRTLTGALMLLFLAAIFIGFAATVLPVLTGNDPEKSETTRYRDSLATVGPSLVMVLLLLLLGVWIPPPLANLLHDAVRLLEVRP